LEGDYLISLKRPADATASYQRAFQAHPSVVLVERLVASDIRDGKAADAKKLMTDWASAHPTDLPSRFALANFELGQKDWAGAQTHYEALLTDQPDNPLVLNNLAFLYQRAGDARALDMARKAHGLAPQSPAITDTLGWIMVQKNDAANGLRFLMEAHQEAPDDLDVQYHLAFALGETGKKAEAADLLKKALAVNRDFDSKKDAQSLLDKLSKG
jgi:predicted Zn-dependent protease